MSERSVKCPECVFSFCRLVDAGDFHAYVCPSCGWSRETEDRRSGNRPADVCSLCDGPIDLTSSNHHLYLGPGWVHGGGREHAPIHNTCANAARAAQRTGTIWTDGCLCPPSWQEVTGLHMVGCEYHEAAS